MMISQAKKMLSFLFERFVVFQSNRFSERRERRLLNLRGGKCKRTENEHTWIKYWQPIVKCRSVWAFRLYSKYCGETKYILSQPVADALNRSLNPEELLPYYADKNIFDKILPKGVLPKTILRVMDGLVMDEDYNIIGDISDSELAVRLKPYTRVILKPTVETSSGRGVCLFNLESEVADKRLSMDLIRRSGRNIIVQEALEQSQFMAQFNPTSVNTIRIATYKSPNSGEVYILSAVIRMGATDAVVDNLHQDGHMIRVNEETGRLAKVCFNADGIASNKHGDIDFSKESFIVPGWDRIIDFAKLIAHSLPHLKLLQLDIAIDSYNNPRLLEFNAEAFSMWIAQFTGTPALGKYTDEIRRYALSQTHSVKICQTRH